MQAMHAGHGTGIRMTWRSQVTRFGSQAFPLFLLVNCKLHQLIGEEKKKYSIGLIIQSITIVKTQIHESILQIFINHLLKIARYLP